MTALRGVRSSWDMLARNSDLWRLAVRSRPWGAYPNRVHYHYKAVSTWRWFARSSQGLADGY